jgi:signal transduction histidine kinase
MARWRPPALVVDSLLATALALFSLGTAETGQSVQESPAQEIHWTISPPPSDGRAGDVWDAKIVVFRGSEPADAPGRTPPSVELRSGTTWTTTTATPTGAPGFYRARVMLHGDGPYAYAVLVDNLGEPPATSEEIPFWFVILTLLATLPVALRRRLPLAVLAVTLAAALGATYVHDAFVFPGALVALYTVAAYVGRPRSLYAAGATAAVLVLHVLAIDSLGFWELLGIYALFGAAWLLGDNVRTRRERARRLEAEHESNVRRAAAEEQARIARELHDVIGHSVSVMTIQAAAAGDAFDSRPAEVREALRAIESTGREALTELRRLLAGENGSFAPAPGLESLGALAERVRSAGLAVELSAEPASLPPSLDLTAYRIVQEALTNTLKHARATTARVDVSRRNGVLEIEVVDDGQGAATVTPGHGIIGMRERAALFGGELTAGPAPGGGFAVRARIPVEEP